MSAKKEETDKTRLRRFIVEVAERIAESDELHRKDGKEPSLAALTDAAKTLCQIYGLLEKIGDFEEGGSALNDYRTKFNQGRGGRARR